MAKVWQSFSAEQVYRADSLGVIRTGAQWLTMLSVGWVVARWRRARPRSLLDNAPLAELLERMVPWQRLLIIRAERMQEPSGRVVASHDYPISQSVLHWDRTF